MKYKYLTSDYDVQQGLCLAELSKWFWQKGCTEELLLCVSLKKNHNEQLQKLSNFSEFRILFILFSRKKNRHAGEDRGVTLSWNCHEQNLDHIFECVLISVASATKREWYILRGLGEWNLNKPYYELGS